MVNINGTKANDTLVGTDSADRINGKAGNDIITASYGNDTLTGGSGNDTLTGGVGKDTFVYNGSIFYQGLIEVDGTDIITDFGGVGKGTNPTAAVIAEVDTIQFLDSKFTTRNLLLTQNGSNLEITFETEDDNTKIILQNFKLEDLDNLKASGTRPAIGNILFAGETSITDDFNVLDANSTDTSIGIKNTVTFLNDLNNNITGLDNSDDVVNGQEGNDKIDGLSGDDLLRGGTGNNTLIGGLGNDTLDASYSSGNNILRGDAGDDYLDASYSTGNNILRGDVGDDYLDISDSTGNNTVSGGDGNDSLYVSAPFSDTVRSYLVTQTVDGGKDDDLLSIDYNYAITGITTTFDATTNIGLMTASKYQVSYQNIERLNILDTNYDDNIVGSNGNDTIEDIGGKDTIDGGKGDDLLSVDYSNATTGITTTFNATTNAGSIQAGTYQVSYKNIERLNIPGTYYDDNIVGSNGNDTLSTGFSSNDTLTGGAGKDTFVYNGSYEIENTDTITITDFGGVGKKTNPTAAVIAKVDTIQFLNSEFTARNLLLTQNGSNLEITFENVDDTTKIILQNFKLEDLDNLKASGTRPAIGNILFAGETSITDDFNVLNANSTDTSICIKNTVTFLNDLDNNITGLDDSDDVINGQEGNDKIDGKSGDDLLRGGAGNDTLIGGVGNDTLVDDTGNNSLVGGIGEDTLNVDSLTGKNTLDGGAGNDTLYARGSQGNNLLLGGDGNDFLNASKLPARYGFGYDFIGSSGNNTLNGGVGDDTLSANSLESNSLLFGDDGNDVLSASSTNGYINTLNGGAGDDILRAEVSTGNNLLSGDNGNDYLSISGNSFISGPLTYVYDPSSGNNTLNGGIGDDTLDAEISTGNNLLSGDDGNDYLTVSGRFLDYGANVYNPSSGNNTLNGGAGDDTLRAEISTGNNLLSGGDGNDSLYLSTSDTATSSLVTQTVDGGQADDLLSVDYSNASGGITTTFNAPTNIGSMTAGKYRVSYKNIERLNISGTAYNDNIVGSNGNDTLSTGSGGKDTIDGGKGDDLLSVDYSNATTGITTTFNATTNAGSIQASTYQVSYKNIERLNITGTAYNDNIVGNNGNDTLSINYGGKDTIDGGKGDDLLSVLEGSYINEGFTKDSGITSTFNATTNTGSITLGTNQISYKNIERLNISNTFFTDSYFYNDYIVGSNGNDTINEVCGGSDTIDGGKGNDLLTIKYYNGTEGITSTFNAITNTGSIIGGTTNQVSYKNIEQLNFSGSYYDDLIVGTNGNDTLTGGNGNDSLYGGAGTDTFVLDTDNQGVNRLYDFNATNELIEISTAGFSSDLSPGVLKASQFTIGASATTTSQRFIYNSTTGGLFFDSDGSAGAFTQVQFAQLSPGLSLTNNNFVLFYPY